MELNFVQAYLLTLFLETAVLFLILRTRYAPLQIVRNSLLANSITLPFVWFVFPLLPWQYPLPLALSEIFAWGVESILYQKLFPERGWPEACKISLLCNAVSFATGLFTLFFLP